MEGSPWVPRVGSLPLGGLEERHWKDGEGRGRRAAVGGGLVVPVGKARPGVAGGGLQGQEAKDTYPASPGGMQPADHTGRETHRTVGWSLVSAAAGGQEGQPHICPKSKGTRSPEGETRGCGTEEAGLLPKPCVARNFYLKQVHLKSLKSKVSS